MVGDGTQDPVTVAGDKLNNQEELKRVGSALSMPREVKDARKTLGDKVFE